MKLKLTPLLLLLTVAALLSAGCSREAKKNRHLQRADAHFKTGDFDRAEIEYHNVIRLERTNRSAIRNLALIAYDRGQTARGVAYLTQAKQVLPEDTEVRLRLGMSYLAGGLPREARAEALFVLGRQPTNQEALFLLTDSTVNTNLQETLEWLEQFKSAAPGAPGYFLALGNLQLRTNDLTRAEASFRQALAADPKSGTAHMAVGNLAMMRNDRELAAVELKQAAELAPLRSTHRVRYADFKLATGDLPGARALLEEIVRQTPDYSPAQLRLAELALTERKFPECAAHLKQIFSRDQNSPEGMLLSAQMRLAEGEPAKAVAELERTVKVFPSSPVFTRLAIAQIANNDVAGAVTSLNQALAKAPGNPEAVLLLAELDIRRGDSAAAVRALVPLVQKMPGLNRAQLLLATAYSAGKDLDAALRVYENLGRTYPTNAQPMLLAGLVLRQQQKNREARVKFEAALSAAPQNLPALEQLIELDMVEQKFADARQRVQLEIDRNPKAPEPLLLLARIEGAQTNLTACEATLLKALELSPGYGPAEQMLARLFVAANKQDQALKKLDELVSKNTNDVASLLQIATLQSAASNYTAAAQAYEKILAIYTAAGTASEKRLAVSPAYIAALNNLAWLYAEQLGNLNRAYELAGKGRDLQPTNSFMADTLGWVLYRRGDYSHALALLREGADKLSDQGEVLYHVGMAHYMMGEEAAAGVALQNAVALGHSEPWVADARAALENLALDPAGISASTVARIQKQASERQQDPVLLGKLAQYYERTGDLKNALATYEKALNANSNSVTTRVKLAQLYSTVAKDSKRALQLAHDAHRLAADDPEIMHTLGRLACEERDYEWAASLLRESAIKRPNDPEVQFDFALAEYHVGNVTQAITAMQFVTRATPASPRSAEAKEFIQVAQWADEPAQAAAAAADIKALLARRPDFVPAMMAGALVKEGQGDHAAARDAYESVLRLAPQFSPAVKALAVLYFERLRDTRKARDFALRAREAYPRDPQVARVLGLLDYQLKDYANANQLLTEAATRIPKDAEMLYCLGISRFNLKQNDASKEALKEALALAPNSPLAGEAKGILAKLK